MKGLIVKSPWIDKILSGEKPWEIRGNNTKIRGRIALIKSGTGMIYGKVNLIRSIYIAKEYLPAYKELHCIDDIGIINYKKPYVWIIQNPVKFNKPIPYNHKQGAVIWVNLPDDILKEVQDDTK